MISNPFNFEIDPAWAWTSFKPSATQPWTPREAAHLLRRAGFGGTPDEVHAAHQAGVTTALEQLFDLDAARKYDAEMATAGRLVSGGTDAKQLAAWWLLKMAQTPCPLQEKMTLFWHGHFATGAEKVNDARAMLRQNQLLRAHCLSEFGPLVSAISRDVAMLIYLDSTENRKTRPNENYARELMELFCLGPGNYTEQDIKEIARCFTGWEVRKNTFRFNAYQHDAGDKQFLGIRGAYDGEDAIKYILEQPVAARFIAKKLIRFFVFDDAEIPDRLAEPIAKELRENDFRLQPAVKKILGSNLFYSDSAIAKKIKSPVELVIGVLRFFEASVNMQRLAEQLQRLGQLPLFPPNVKGWEGGRSWINASTILARANLIHGILTSNQTEFAAGNLKQWAKKQGLLMEDKPALWVGDLLLAQPPAEPIPSSFAEQFNQNPAIALSWLAALPEFQLN